MELQKNVPNTGLQDITWSLRCTDGRVQDVADIVKSLQLRMESFEEGMSMVRNLTEEISKLKEFVLTLTKENGKRSRWSEIEVPPKNGKRSRWSEIEVPPKNGKRINWFVPESPPRKNHDNSFLLRE